MKIYADTSFLVSLLYPGDARHKAARVFYAARLQDEWLISEWSLFETVNSLRQLCLRNHGPKPPTAEAIRRLFKSWHERGPFLRVKTDTDEAMTECQQLSALHAATLKMRSADVLHVALLEQINPDLFVTRDQDQHDLAAARGFRAQFLP